MAYRKYASDFFPVDVSLSLLPVKKGRKMVCIRHQINQVHEIKRTGTKWAFLEMRAEPNEMGIKTNPIVKEVEKP